MRVTSLDRHADEATWTRTSHDKTAIDSRRKFPREFPFFGNIGLKGVEFNGNTAKRANLTGI